MLVGWATEDQQSLVSLCRSNIIAELFLHTIRQQKHCIMQKVISSYTNELPIAQLVHGAVICARPT